ncbi:ARF-like 2 binding protein BART domain-containing protein [Chloropicon primus]|uniref:BART domain-containing protein n=1 Tax=Chloropicon primus TaxID=1764295 RepID=A0A5B8MVQ7_9CHLO|nr:hypothetical protein A3770_13p70150 [Chloropicon primus]UPR03706.1 ARF-like 2 binding protein BART domain-containing protein [Chloropicon primus]|eukprot:QDZ24497.1 hypothetical protein A3770_13p70150 [Chloropicon primus]
MVVVEISGVNSMEQCSEASEQHNDLVQKLEEYFTSPEIMVEVGDYFHGCANKLHYVGTQTGENDLEETHPLSNYDIFTSYGEMIEKFLQTFLKENSKSPDELYEACLREKLENENGWAVCLDYLIASLDYEYFLQIAYDFSNL